MAQFNVGMAQRDERPSQIKPTRQCLKKFTAKPSEERTIEFTDLGVPTGPNMNAFQRYLSHVAKTHLGCLVSDWKLSRRQR